MAKVVQKQSKSTPPAESETRPTMKSMRAAAPAPEDRPTEVDERPCSVEASALRHIDPEDLVSVLGLNTGNSANPVAAAAEAISEDLAALIVQAADGQIIESHSLFRLKVRVDIVAALAAAGAQ